MFKDPAYIFVVCLLLGFFSLIVFAKISSDREEKKSSEQKKKPEEK